MSSIEKNSTGSSEPETASRHIRKAVINGIGVKGFYGDCAFDTNDLFDMLHSISAKVVIKIRKNTSADWCSGSIYRRRVIRENQEKGYKTWAEEKRYGMRLSGTDGIFSAVKRKFGENCMTRSAKDPEADGFQRLWKYDYINQGARERVKTLK